MKSIPPGAGPARCTHFPYVKTPQRTKWTAHVAGPAVWVLAHGDNRTVVCSQWFTDGELLCQCCATGVVARVVGYQPLYREQDGRPCMVIVYEDVRHVVDELTLHQRVIVGREGDGTATVWIAPALVPDPVYQTTLPERRRPADISRSLLAVWRDRELMAWYYATQPGTQPGPVVMDRGSKPRAARAAPLAAEVNAPPPPPPPPLAPVDDAAPVGDLLSGTLARVRRKEASRNGKQDVTS